MDDEHEKFLGDCLALGEIAPCTHHHALTLWHRLRALGLPVPAAAVLDGNVFCYWDKGEHHFNVDVLADDTAGWFYRDRTTEDCWYAESSGPFGAPPDFEPYALRVRA